jgi:hypothetical protein
VGGLLLDLVGFRSALWIMAALLGIIFVAGRLLLPRQLGKAKSSKTMRELFAKSRAHQSSDRNPDIHVWCP